MSVNHGGATLTFDSTKVLDIDASGHKNFAAQALSTVAENIDIGSDLTWTTVSLVALKNTSSNSAEIITITKSAVNIGKLKAGESMIYRPAGDGTAMTAVSASGTPILNVLAVAAA